MDCFSKPLNTCNATRQGCCLCICMLMQSLRHDFGLPAMTIVTTKVRFPFKFGYEKAGSQLVMQPNMHSVGFIGLVSQNGHLRDARGVPVVDIMDTHNRHIAVAHASHDDGRLLSEQQAREANALQHTWEPHSPDIDTEPNQVW